jgi:hypothetical protein
MSGRFSARAYSPEWDGSRCVSVQLFPRPVKFREPTGDAGGYSEEIQTA